MPFKCGLPCSPRALDSHVTLPNVVVWLEFAGSTQVDWYSVNLCKFFHSTFESFLYSFYQQSHDTYKYLNGIWLYWAYFSYLAWLCGHSSKVKLMQLLQIGNSLRGSLLRWLSPSKEERAIKELLCLSTEYTKKVILTWYEWWNAGPKKGNLWNVCENEQKNSGPKTQDQRMSELTERKWNKKLSNAIKSKEH